MNKQGSWLSLMSCLVLMALGGLSFTTRLYAATTVALVSTCGGQAGQDVLALAETALSAEADIVLVERREVERVLQEQELMHCGMSEAGQAVMAGKLLGVQVFASLETVPNQQEAVGLTVFDAATGVVLWDSVLSDASVEQAAAEVDAAVKAGCEKRQLPAGGPITVCFLSVRNADLPREFDSLCQSVGSILQRQLVQSPSLAILDRQHLENVNKERLLPAGVQTNELLPSLVLIDLEISRGHMTNGLAATAILSGSGDTKVGQASAAVEARNPAELSDRLLIELERLLKAKPSEVVVDRAREANRFAREARFLADSVGLANGVVHTDPAGFADGLRAIEAANALMPTNREFQEQLVEHLGMYAGQQIGGGRTNRDALNYALDLGLRGLEISRSLRDQAIARKGEVDGPEANIWLAPQHWLNGWYFWDRVLLVANNQDADTTQKILEFQQRCRELELNFVDQRAQAEVKDPHRFSGGYTQTTDALLRNIEKYVPSSSVWTADTLNCLRSWLKLAEQFPLDGDGSQCSTRMLARLCLQNKGPWRLGGSWGSTRVYRLDDWKLQPADYAQFDTLFQEMARHPDPVVAAYGLAGQLSSSLRNASPASSEVDQQYRTAKDFIRTHIAVPGRGAPKRYRELLYGAALDLIDLLPDPQTRQREYQDLFDFMLDRKEIEYWVTRVAIDPHPHLYRHYNTTLGYGGTYDIFPETPDPHLPDNCAPLIDNAQRVRALLRSGGGQDIDTAGFSYNTGSFERELVWIQRDIKTEPVSGSSVPWESAKLLFPASGQSSGGSIVSVAAASNAFYAVLSGTPLRIFHIPLDGGQPTLLGEALYQGYYYGIPNVAIPAVGEQKVFVGTDEGIFVFPLDGRRAQHITTADGLPTDNVTSLACLDGKVYAGLDGGYVIGYDLKAKKCQILASSRRRDARNGLDNVSPPPIIKYMMSDPERHRVLFTVSLGMNVPCVPELGLWQIDTITGQVTQLVQLYSQPVWAALIGDGTMLIRFNRYGGIRTCDGAGCGVVSYELATGRTRLLSACDQKAAGPQIPAPEGVLRMPLSAYPPHVIIDGWVWFDNGRVSTNAAALEYFPASKETAGAVPFAWKSYHLLGGHSQMAIAGPNGIWLFTLKTRETSAGVSKDSP